MGFFYDISLIGKVKAIHLTFGKCNAEIEPIIKNIKHVRGMTKAGDFQRHETNNFNEDSFFGKVTLNADSSSSKRTLSSLKISLIVSEREVLLTVGACQSLTTSALLQKLFALALTTSGLHMTERNL